MKSAPASASATSSYLVTGHEDHMNLEDFDNTRPDPSSEDVPFTHLDPHQQPLQLLLFDNDEFNYDMVSSNRDIYMDNDDMNVEFPGEKRLYFNPFLLELLF